MIELRPLTLKQANKAVRDWHRHHKPTRGQKFSIGAFIDGELVGAVIVGRPKAAGLDDGLIYEVTRLSCRGGDRNVGTRLLGAASRAAEAMGYQLGVSYTRVDELGSVYKAAGWKIADEVEGRDWTTGNKGQRWLPGTYEPTTEVIDRVRWERRRTG